MRMAEISLEAVRHNVKRILEASSDAHLIAVVKANGYGHNAALIADAAFKAGASIIGVTDLGEAFRLRKAGITAPVLSWLHGPDADFAEALKQNIELGISRPEQLDAVATASKETKLIATLHLKVDSGLSRGGLAPSSWAATFAKAKQLQDEGVIEVKGIFSHLSNAGAEEDLLQAANFDRAIAALEEAGIDPQLKHLSSTAATLSSPHLRYNAVRVGLGLYGLSPFEDKTSADLGLRPVMTLKCQVIALRTVERGAGISYSYIYRAPGETKLALIPMGYADGLPRLLNQTGASVTVRGVACPIVGRIAMDQCVIDLTPLGVDAELVEVGEYVTLFGDPQRGVASIDDWAQKMQTINYEIAARLGSRIEQVPVDD